MSQGRALGTASGAAVRVSRPPLRPLAPRPLDNLPLQLTGFVGREPELADVRRLLAAARLVTLTGPGGIGKTRLALEAAARARDDYPDGVWLVELAALAEASLITQALAAPLGLRAAAEAPLEHILEDYLRPRHLLLVLDNCEHVVAECAASVESLLRACPNLRILATSRESLRVPGEVTWRVPALSLPGDADPSATPTSLLGFEAVRLFVERAAAAAGFELSEQNAAAVARLCQRLEGIPLAIELAAARAGFLSVEQIASRLDDRFRLLVSGSRNAPVRQQTLRAAIDWSYELLTPTEQRLLARLSVFAGGWTLDAAEAVCGGDGLEPREVLELLARLLDKSLVSTEPGPGGQSRYRLLDSMREYAQQRLRDSGPDQARAAARQHCAFYSGVAAEVEAHVLWGADDLEWRARLDPELANLRAALGWTLSAEGDTLSSLRLVAHLGHFWYTRGDRAEGCTWLRRALDRARADVAALASDEARLSWAWALLWSGGLAHGQSQYLEATACLDQALGAFEQLRDRRGVGWALSFLGYVARAQSDLEGAADLLERAVAALEAIGDRLNMIPPLAALGFTVAGLGDQQRATRLLEQSVALAEQTGSHGRLAIASLYLGQVAFAQGDTARAATAWEQGLRLANEWGSAWGLAECLEGLAVIAGAAGRPARAARLLGAAARLRESIGAPVHPVDQPEHDRTLERIQAQVGQQAFIDAWTDGQNMPLAAVIDYAVGARPAADLTAREREVALLIARGQSNRQIAQALMIAERTAANHVEHILNKLGFHSRTQVATWATEQRLRGDV